MYSSSSDKEYQGSITSLFHHYLHLSPSNRLVDLAGGTGTLAASLAKAAGLTSPVSCVDPSKAMVAMVEGREGVEGVCMGAEEWSRGGGQGDTDRVMIRGAIHHFNRCRLCTAHHTIPDATRELLPTTLEGILRRLAVGGRLVVEKPADTFVCLPYPARVVALMDSMEPQR